MITINSNGIGDFPRNGIWAPSKGRWDDLLWVSVICAATVVLVPCIVGLKIASVVTRPLRGGE